LTGVVEGVKGGVSAIGSGVRELGGKVLDVVKWVGESLGFVAREAEAGTIDMVKAAGVVAHTKGDIGGMSAGMYQFTREAQLKFLKEYGYMKEFEGVRCGTPEWKKRWQEVASKYGMEFAKAQQEFAVKEYFMPGSAVAERFGIDVSKSRALQEMVFARAIQHGVGGFRGVLGNVVRGMAPEQLRAMSPEEVITRVYDHLIENVDRYWASSAPKVRAGVRKRLMREKELLLAVERQKEEVKKQVGLQRGVSRQVKELQDSIKEGVEIYETGGEELKGISKGIKELKESMQVDLLAGSYLDYEPGEKIFAPFSIPGDEVVAEGRVMDDVLVADQQEVARRVIDEGVRTSAEWLNNMMRVIEGLRSAEKAGGERRLVMSGGDAFSKVPLFPEDVGLVMMMLGLV
jgi:hypothetical protein